MRWKSSVERIECAQVQRKCKRETKLGFTLKQLLLLNMQHIKGEIQNFVRIT